MLLSREGGSQTALALVNTCTGLANVIGSAAVTLLPAPKNRVKVKFLGDLEPLSDELKTLIAETEKISQKYDGVQVNLCVNYGGRDEIVRAVNACMRDAGKDGAPVTEESFSRYLYTDGIPDPDLIIRPSGEYRLSNFLMWQSAYSELYFTDVLWPDFDKNEMNRAICEYQTRDRRYGGIK